MSGNAAHHDKQWCCDDEHADPDELDSEASEVASREASERSRTRSQTAMCYEYIDEDGEHRRIRVAQDVDPSEPDAITEVERDGREFDAKTPELRLPATGGQYNDCGEEAPLLACPNCGEVTVVGRTCRRSRCPRCWQAWDFQRALDAGTAIEGERRYRYASGETNTKYHHLTVSLPRSLRFARSDPLDAAFKLVMRLLGMVGVFAGWLAYHPYRIRKEYRGDVNGHESGEGDMQWKDILEKIESDEWTWEAVREEFLVYAPHFHGMVNADFVQGGAVTEAIEEQTGVVIHRITKGDSAVSLGNLEDLMSATAYSLSHAGISWDEDNEAFRGAFRFFGSTADVERRKNVEDDVKAALREVSSDVLGVDFGSQRCDAETIDEDALDDAEHADHSADGGASARTPVGRAGVGLPLDSEDSSEWSGGNSGGYATGREVGNEDSWTASAGVSPSYLDDPSEAEADLRSRCGAKLAPIWAAEEWLVDEEWVANHDAETLDELREALAEYRERGGDPPVPPDAPDPPD
jgi:predicted RNA-binding Zn-ribbon protein involved in translation (DUF1610 family)